MKGAHLKCIVTGWEKYFTPKLMAKRISKFGTETQVQLHYICMDAKRLLKQGLTVDEIREKLGITENLPKVNLQILSRLKLLKKPKSQKKLKAAEEKAERIRYLNSREYKDKMLAIEERNRNLTFQEWVERYTGTGRERGGTCLRPDIFLSHNNKACDGCPYYEFCLCYGKRLSHEKKKRRRR